MPKGLLERRLPSTMVAEHAQARPLIDFRDLNREIKAALKEARKFRGKFPAIHKAEKKSRWRVFRHPIKNKLVGGGYEGWLILHPLKLLGSVFTVFSKEKAGALAFRKEKTRMAAAAAWRNESGVERHMRRAYGRYKNKMVVAAARLEGALTAPNLTQLDAFRLKAELFDSPAEQARQAFRGEITGILKRFRGDYKEHNKPVIGAIDKGIIPKRARQYR